MQGRPWYIFGSQNPRYLIENPEDPLLRIAECCKPIPGDKIIGFVNRNMEIEIHRHLCELFSELRQSKASDDKPLEVEWHLPKTELRSHTMNIEVDDGRGILYQITKIITSANAAIELSESKSLPGQKASIKIRLEPVTWSNYHRIMEGLRPLKFINKIN